MDLLYILSGNIKSGVKIFNVTGSLVGASSIYTKVSVSVSDLVSGFTYTNNSYGVTYNGTKTITSATPIKIVRFSEGSNSQRVTWIVGMGYFLHSNDLEIYSSLSWSHAPFSSNNGDMTITLSSNLLTLTVKMTNFYSYSGSYGYDSLREFSYYN